MIKTTDIQYIRRLVEKFYQGETSPAEEWILAEYFNETSQHDIPEDLAKDAEVFRSISLLLPKADEIQIPDDLESQLAEITNVMPEKKGSRKFRIAPFILKAASIAAAACLIWGLLTFIPRWAGFQPTDQSELTAETNIEDAVKIYSYSENAGWNPTHLDSLLIEPETTDKEEIKTNKKPLIKQKTPRRIAQCKPKAQSQIATVPSDFVAGSHEDGFIEITDPEEARQIMENIGNLLAANFCESDKAISTVSASIESYKEITKTILQ